LTKPHASVIIDNRLTEGKINQKDLGNTECQSELINPKFVAVCVFMVLGNECLQLMEEKY